jgi:hypothetical protein
MKRTLFVLLAFVVAALSVFGVWFVLVLHVMRSLPSVIETTMLVSLAVIAIGLCVALVQTWTAPGGWPYRVALAIMLVAGATPYAVYFSRAAVDQIDGRAERKAIETAFLSKLEANKKDLSERIAAQKPFTPREAYKFVEFVKESDLSYRLLPDHSSTTFLLLKQALDAKILDPNARLKGPTRVDVNEEPLFVVYYKFYLQSGVTMPTKAVREREWKLLQMLVAAGANLDDPAAAVLRDVVNRETAPYEIPGYIRLK